MPIFASVGTGSSPWRMAKKSPTVIPKTSCRMVSVGMMRTSHPWDAGRRGRIRSCLPSAPGRKALADQVLGDVRKARFERIDDGPHAARPREVGMDDEPEVVDLDGCVGEDAAQLAVGIADGAGQSADADPERHRTGAPR